jgi:hypothetical protein
VIWGELPVTMTITTIAATFPHVAAFLPFAFGDPRATKMMDLGKESMTVVMYTQNFIPVQENKGLAKSRYIN